MRSLCVFLGGSAKTARWQAVEAIALMFATETVIAFAWV
jgi:hypothetical protein